MCIFNLFSRIGNFERFNFSRQTMRLDFNSASAPIQAYMEVIHVIMGVLCFIVMSKRITIGCTADRTDCRFSASGLSSTMQNFLGGTTTAQTSFPMVCRIILIRSPCMAQGTYNVRQLRTAPITYTGLQTIFCACGILYLMPIRTYMPERRDIHYFIVVTQCAVSTLASPFNACRRNNSIPLTHDMLACRIKFMIANFANS